MPPPIAPAVPATTAAAGASGAPTPDAKNAAPAPVASSFAPPTAPSVIAPPRPKPCSTARSFGSACAFSSSFRRSSTTLKICASEALIFS